MQGDIFMETRGTDVKPSSWTRFEERILKECVFYLNAADKLNELSLHEMYNNAVRMSQEFSVQSQQRPYANQRSLGDIQRMINNLQKLNDVFAVILKNQININSKQ